MRKATLRSGDKVIEIEMPDEWDNELPDWLREFLGLKQTAEAKTSESIERRRSTKSRILTKELMLGDEWILLVELSSERRRKSNSKCNVYSNKHTSEILGVINSETGYSHLISLGKPNDPQSKIVIIMKAVDTMPVTETFKRRDLADLLPPSFGKGDILRAALGYVAHIGKIILLQTRDPSTGAFLYQRVVDKDNSGNQVGTQATGVSIPLSNAKQ